MVYVVAVAVRAEELLTKLLNNSSFADFRAIGLSLSRQICR